MKRSCAGRHGPRDATLLLSLVAGIGAASTAREVSAAPSCTLELRGRVLDASTGEPLPRATVEVASKVSADTDARGEFLLSGLCAGPASLSARRADYVMGTVTTTLPRSKPQDILLEPHKVTRIEDVVVEAPRLNPADTRATTRLDSEALERTRGRNLADALAEVPGVSVLRSGATAKPIVRGLSGARVLVLFDRVRHESQDWGLDHGTEIDPFSAGAMAVIKGAAGVRHGPDAIAGVLLIDPPPMLDAPGWRSELQLVGALNGRRGTVAARVDGAPAWLPGLALRLEGNVSKGRAMSTPDYPLDNTGLEEWNVGGAARWQRGPLSLAASYAHLDLSSGLCNCIRNDSPEDFVGQLGRQDPIGVDGFVADYAIDRPYQDVTHDRLILRGAYDLEASGEVELTYAFQVNHRQEYDVVRSAVQGPQFDFTLRTHTLDGTWSHPPVDVGAAQLRGTVGFAGQAQENVFDGIALIPNFRAFGAGLFAIERLSWGRSDIEAGARYDVLKRDAFLDAAAYRRHLARGSLAQADCEVGGDVARCPSTFHAGSLSLGLITQITEQMDFKIDLSSATRVPTIDEQYINGTAPSFPVLALGDPSLGPETSWSLSGTLQLQTEWVSAEVSAYGSYIDDYIYFAPELDQDGQPIIDEIIRGAFPRFSHRAVNALLYGGELGLTMRFGPVDVDLQGALVRGQDVTRDAPLVFVPPDRGRVAVTYHPPDFGPLEDNYFKVDVGVVAEQTRFDPKADLAPPPGGYALLGAAAGTAFGSSLTGVQRLRVSVEVSNLLNKRYRDYTSLLRYYADEPGLQVFLRIGAVLGASPDSAPPKRKLDS